MSSTFGKYVQGEKILLGTITYGNTVILWMGANGARQVVRVKRRFVTAYPAAKHAAGGVRVEFVLQPATTAY